MLQNIKNRKEGFTIIEVLIVLAIAGLILLVVFLAVPALQRNSRNTQRKNEVANILGAISEYTNNNSGTLPDSTTFATALQNAKLSLYNGKVTLSTADSNTTDPSNVQVRMSAKCSGSDSTTTGASARQFVAMYTVETGGGTQKICQES